MNACDLRAFLQTITMVLRKCQRLGISTTLFVCFFFFFGLMKISKAMEQDKEGKTTKWPHCSKLRCSFVFLLEIMVESLFLL